MGTASAAIKRAAVVRDRLQPPPAGITILIYHRVGGRTPVSVDLPTSLFDEQMAYLAERTNVLSLTKAADLLDAGETPDDARPHVVVTFDDGTADFVDEALPVLVRHGVPATYYLATDFLDRQRPFPDAGQPMSWAAAEEARTTGLVDLGSHTHTHVLLDRVPPAEAAEELDRSIGAVEDHVGVTPAHFAYPKALLGSPENEREVRARFRTATIGRTRPNPWRGSDLHRLTRSPVQTTDGMEFFERKVAGGMRLEDDVRDLVNRWRYRGATG
ncbi:MAG TPA: polysaccharide deacetylase family protein [Acidimicrobiales bacterium]|nr:polysaccharide deacetylase family protein [Acidimicrobiales bacterium]